MLSFRFVDNLGFVPLRSLNTLLTAGLLFVASTVHADTASFSVATLPTPARAYLNALIEQAGAAQLWARPEWLNLVHYKPNLLWPGMRSLADDPDFFLSVGGKIDPQAELEATLASFFSDVPETDKQQNPQCRFIARYHWLKEQLQFDPVRLPPQPCRRFENWRSALNPAGITLVFPAAYLNSPASMYGHTLLRIDAKDQDERTRLLAYTVNYAANTNETSGLVFAIKGLLGGYSGVFSIAPYYLKVRDYNDLENRDIWEYQLDFTESEVDRLLMHMWELGPISFDYYFFDENCSYHLLSLFEVARPSLDITNRFRWWAIPSDTVRAVTDQEGLLKHVVYRPAAATVLRHRLKQLSVARYELVQDLAYRRVPLDDTRLAALAPAEQAAVIEATYEYADYRRLVMHDQSPTTATYLRSLLLVRSRLPTTELPAVPMPSVRPDQGHGSARVDTGGGYEGGVNYTNVRMRAAYHDLLDLESGYNRGAQIEYFALELRRYEGKSTRVEELRLLDILSLTPRDAFFNPWSWKINSGAVRRRLPNSAAPLVARVNGGMGFSWETSMVPDSLVSLLMEGTLDIKDEFEHGYALGAGPSLSWLKDLTPSWRLHLYLRHQRFGMGHTHSVNDLTLAQRYALGRDSAVRFDLWRRGEFGLYRNGAQVTWMVYF